MVVSQMQNHLTTQNLSVQENKYLSLHNKGSKIKDLDQDGFKQLDERILYISKIIGIQELPDETLRGFLLQFLKEHFSEFTIAELTEAVSMALALKLDIDEASLKTFGKLTPQWFSLILTKYRQNRNKVVVKHRQEMELAESRQKNERQLTDSERLEFYKDLLEKCYDNYCESGEISDFMNKSYDFLDINDKIPFSNEEKKAIYKEAQVIFKTEKKNNTKNPYELTYFLNNLDKEYSNSKNQIKAIAKRVALKHFFNKYVKNGKDLLNLLSQCQKTQS